MNWINAMIITFSMYSKIPMPRMEWKEKDMKYAMIFFPFVGAVVGGTLFVWWILSERLGIEIFFKSALAVSLPIIITGGIHLDGFLDTMDAISSYQPREKKLEILKDPHTGAFAIISGLVYVILYIGAVSEINTQSGWLIMCLGFIVSRSLSGLSLVWFPSAKKEGLLHTFSEAAHRRLTRIVLLLVLILTLTGMIFCNPVQGIVAGLTAGSVFFYYKRLSFKEFGGITGDLAGFFLQICELFIVISLAFTDKL
ncbi:adenosylcobinamide-GDP ribazoletransferase [Anaerocolumna cellulosilytica]|uniref:Adenosylcobinamide-GDP ribazoletransferase n=1 Tax=Anaerocolumna cellulosilytica TaxID=433286 RepID=A0A6S6RAX8_9FIRM|nr:adenosylcobinamide-GDP ribazoletransferase [Anaerocolumna cellulosilytica]MBB5196364.1 adenosylcobinamide-GDP ribazoletransferase [Anaerocolumna cellulosilytica]BCJ96392.1 adenosylcobinamide-GDP ribazoletransferase [Anaerocolumna cellulosilytica]